MMVRFLRILGVVVFLAVLAGAFLFWRGFGAGPIPPASVDFATLDPAARAALTARGERVARAGDCTACHADPDGGSALGGGLPMKTPMGTIYGTNITPSKDHGIGNWTADDLYRAITQGVAPGNRNLYPAMPYVSYHEISREDSDAVYAWLMAQPPVEKPNRALDMPFPFNMRIALTFWNGLFRPAPEPYQPVAGAKEYTFDGRYLVDVLGHCGECHTPRNLAYAMTGPRLGGFVIEGSLAPDLRPAELARRGWTDADLKTFLHRGLSPQGVMTLGMFPVLSHSTSYMDETELSAITAYLLGGSGAVNTATAPVPTPVRTSAAAPDARGRGFYLGLCAGCHGPQGEGQPHSSVRLDTNTTAMFDDPLNLVRIIDQGIAERDLAQGERMQKMPPYRHWLSDDDMTALVNYLRQGWGGHAEAVSAADIASARKTYAPYVGH